MRINEALGHAEQRLQVLDALLDQAMAAAQVSLDHHRSPPASAARSGSSSEFPATVGHGLRVGLPPDLPRVANGVRRRPAAKTHGRWLGSDGVVREEVSGWDSKYYEAVEWFYGQPEKKVPLTAADVEVKLAVHMRNNKIMRVELAINNIPCVGEWGCDTLVPRILPRGYTMTIHGSGGFHAIYHGEANP
ncbi:DddA-like double-stranded DNA deaminase toxin [Actinokineospora cianjurensis]|uniref:DddA-like double-stranded DNA deaminase toxin n=1 Tax=Actinokineospora cianjurensis TaxID=585224 RepID=UPI0011C44D9C|nr:DddA-like double-stranded DNA deaminase toxin [Actinokineospora cianjurensis]